MCKDYNGWTNYYTWNYKLWIDNDQGSYNYWQEQTRRLSIRELEDALKDELQEAAADRLEEASCLTDLLGYAIESINYKEIAEHMKEDIED